jgi:hypothetical protein
MFADIAAGRRLLQMAVGDAQLHNVAMSGSVRLDDVHTKAGAEGAPPMRYTQTHLPSRLTSSPIMIDLGRNSSWLPPQLACLGLYSIAGQASAGGAGSASNLGAEGNDGPCGCGSPPRGVRRSPYGMLSFARGTL